jgi:nitrite reductase (NO-forming)
MLPMKGLYNRNRCNYFCNGVLVLFVIVTITLSAFQRTAFDLKASIERGKKVYTAQCLTCHMEYGTGIETVYPPLAKSDYLMADKNRSIRQVLEGLTGEITVNGVKYNAIMTAFDLTDEEVSDVLNYIRNSWGNKGEAIKPEDVMAVRK